MMASSPRPTVALPNHPADWWMLDIQMKIFEFIYHIVVTLGVESALLNNSSFDTLLDDPKLDSAIQLVYRRLRLPGSRGDPPHRTASEWHQDKRKILECLVPIHRGQPPYEPVGDAAEIRPFSTQQASNNSYEPWVTLGIPTGYTETRLLQPYHTPRTPGNLLDRDLASSETVTASAGSDNTATLDDPQSHFSPANSVSRGRRKRSTSSMQNEKPGKRTRGGPQDHVCRTCGKKFPFMSKLKDHLKTHSTEKVLGCHLCTKRFKRTREVNAHLKSVHKIDILQNAGPPAPPTSHPLSMDPATPASLPTHHPSLFPPTPASSSSYQSLPRPSPRPTLLPPSGSYPTPGQFDESTPASTTGTDYRETPAMYTPHSRSYEDDRMYSYREESYRGDEMEDDDGDGKSKADDGNSPGDLADRVERIDMNRDDLKLAPLWKLTQPSSSAAPTPQNTQPQQESLPSIDVIHAGLAPASASVEAEMPVNKPEPETPQQTPALEFRIPPDGAPGANPLTPEDRKRIEEYERQALFPQQLMF